MSENRDLIPKILIPFDLSQKISIDCGSVLTKLIHLDSRTDSDIPYRVFPTTDLEGILKSLGDALNNATEVFITGINRCYAKSIVLALSSVTVVLVDELQAMAFGFKKLLESVHESEILYDVGTEIGEEHNYKFDIDNPIIKKMRQKMESHFAMVTVSSDEKIKRPSIIMWAGATVNFYLLKADETLEPISTSSFGGETFRGISKYLIDSNDYKELTDLANRGRRENLDTQVYEIFAEDPNSPYGKFPPQLPIFAFGKCADHDLNKEDLSIEDIMASLSNLALSDHLTVAVQMCQTYKTNSIYIGGGFFRAPIFDKIIKIRQQMGFSRMPVAILESRYLAALGAMLTHG